MMLLLVREPVKAGYESAYRVVEDGIARSWLEFECPNPHFAMQQDGSSDVWWINAFESSAHRDRVERAYQDHTPLMEMLGRASKQKSEYTGPLINLDLVHRDDLSKGAPWPVAGNRFVVLSVAPRGVAVAGSVFDEPGGNQYTFAFAPTRQEAQAAASEFGATSQIFSICPQWGCPAPAWIDADREFWRSHPLVSTR
jgi:hypothetical protein